MMTWLVHWLRRGNGRRRRVLATIAAGGLLVPLTAAGAAQAATVNTGTLALSPASATAGDTADVFQFKYTAPSKPIPGTISITVPTGFSAPQDSTAGAAGYLSASSSCASFQVSGITTSGNAGVAVTVAVNCAAKATGTLVYEDVTVPTTAGAYPFATSFTPSGSQTAIVFTAQHSVTVKHGPLASLSLSPATATIESGAAQAYTAQGFDAYGNSLGDITSSTKFTISPDGSCTAATCTATATGTHTVTGASKKIKGTATLTVTNTPASHVYWIDEQAGTVNKVNLDGTGETTLVSGQSNPFGVAVHSSRIYWVNQPSGTVMESNLDGTGVTTLVSGQNHPYSVAVDSSHIYWAEPVLGTIMEANLDGTGVTTLLSVPSTGNAPVGLAVNSSHIYWTDASGSGSIMESNLDGTGVTTLVSGQDGPWGVTVDSSHIYWAEPGVGSIMEANLDGTGVTTLVSGQSEPIGVAVDSSHIYWADQGQGGEGTGTVMEANLDGTGVTTLVPGNSTNAPYGVAVGP